MSHADGVGDSVRLILHTFCYIMPPFHWPSEPHLKPIWSLKCENFSVPMSSDENLYPCSTEILAHPSLVGSKVYFFWSPTEDYCVTVRWIWFVFVDYQVSVWRVWRGLMRWKQWKRPMKELIPLFHRAFCSSFTRRKQGLFLLIAHRRLSCHSQMNLICVCRLSGQCLACQVWSDEVKMSDEGTKCRA